MIRATLLISALMCASVAYAGDATVTISGQKGTVMVNSGKQFVSAKKNQHLKQGDRIMVMEGGTATVTYANGCVATVQSGSMVDVNAATCGASPKKVGPMYAQAMGDDEHKDRDRDGGAGWINSPAAGWTGAAIVAIITAIVINNNDADGVSIP